MARFFATAAEVEEPEYTGDLTVGTITTITNDNYYNAWPAITRMANDELLLTYTKGITHHADNSGSWNGKISSDDGTTWGSEFDIYGIAEPLWASVLGASTSSTGRVFTAGFRNDADPPTGFDDQGALLVYSDDNGSTWESAIVLDAGFTDFQLGASAPVEMVGGDLIMPIEGEDTGDTLSSVRVIFSSDDGDTWGSEVVLAEGTRNYYEPCLVVLDNGDILALLRTTDGNGDIYASTSDDAGATWSTPAVAFAGHGMPHVIQGTSGTLIAITRENGAAQQGAVWAYTSLDRGATWNGPFTLDSSMYEMEYGCPVELSEGSYLVVYGYQPTSAITNSDIKQVVVTEVAA